MRALVLAEAGGEFSQQAGRLCLGLGRPAQQFRDAADLRLVSHHALAFQCRVLLQQSERPDQRVGIAIAAAVQADIDLEAEAQIGAELGGERAIFRQPLVGVDQPDDARQCAVDTREHAALQRVPHAVDRHRLAEQQLGRRKSLQDLGADRQMEAHEAIAGKGRADDLQQLQARQRFVDDAKRQLLRQPRLDRGDVGVQPVEVEHQRRLVDACCAQRIRQLCEIRLAHVSIPSSRAM